MDVVCQAKSGMGKTAVFVLATLQQLEPVAGQVSHAMHLALVQYQVYSDYANPHRSKFHYIEQIRITWVEKWVAHFKSDLSAMASIICKFKDSALSAGDIVNVPDDG